MTPLDEPPPADLAAFPAPAPHVTSTVFTMAALTKKQLDQLEQLLDEREQVLHSHLQRDTAAREEFVQVASEAPDSGDASFATLSMDLGHAAVERDLVALRHIANARRRIELGDYGVCAQCGYEIPYARLVAQPTAARCAPCQNHFERTHAGGVSRSAL